MLTEPQVKTLRWILDKLNTHQVPYQIVGGLAAIAHGATRPLADIDLYVDYGKSAAFLAALRHHIYWGPSHEKDAHWDITYLKLNHLGQKLEIGDSNNAQYFDSVTKQWTPQAIDYRASVKKIVYNCAIDVMPLPQLIAYKSALSREVDVQDIEAIQSYDMNVKQHDRSAS